MLNRYVVKTLMLSSGERLPVLLDGEAGIPLFAPTVYSLTHLRARNLASNTIEQALRHVMVLLLFLDQNKIDLEARLREGKVLDLGELEELAAACKLSVASLVGAIGYEAGADAGFIS